MTGRLRLDARDGVYRCISSWLYRCIAVSAHGCIGVSVYQRIERPPAGRL